MEKEIIILPKDLAGNGLSGNGLTGNGADTAINNVLLNDVEFEELTKDFV